MAKIHWSAYVIIGFFVSIVSWKISYDKLYLFFYAGLIFALIGFAKLAISIAGKKKAPKQKTLSHANLHHKAQHQYKRCPRCHNVMRLHEKFCARCGARF